MLGHSFTTAAATRSWSASVLTPSRHRGVEHLDDPRVDASLRARSMRDVRRANLLLGGTHAVLAEVGRVLPALPTHASLLDVGTGLADIPHRARSLARGAGVQLVAYGIDAAESLARTSHDMLDGSTCGDARRLPFADSSVDIVTCSQVLHHFQDADIPLVLAEMHRVARRAVIVSDLRRSWVGASGF